MDNNTTTTNNNNANFRLSISIMSHGSYTLGHGSHFRWDLWVISKHDAVSALMSSVFGHVQPTTYHLRCGSFLTQAPGNEPHLRVRWEIPTNQPSSNVSVTCTMSPGNRASSSSSLVTRTIRLHRTVPSSYTHVRYATGIDKRQVNNNGHNTGNVVH